jgi:hypothetical protein
MFDKEDVMLKSRFVVACAVVLAGLLAAASMARADAAHTNYLTFSAPFALPGVSLPAGTYAFQVVAPGSHDVVRVSSRDGARVYLLAFTTPVDRPNGLRRDYQIVFNEVQAGMAPPVKAWFPIGEKAGHEFIYPASRTSR